MPSRWTTFSVRGVDGTSYDVAGRILSSWLFLNIPLVAFFIITDSVSATPFRRWWPSDPPATTNLVSHRPKTSILREYPVRNAASQRTRLVVGVMLGFQRAQQKQPQELCVVILRGTKGVEEEVNFVWWTQIHGFGVDEIEARCDEDALDDMGVNDTKGIVICTTITSGI